MENLSTIFIKTFLLKNKITLTELAKLMNVTLRTSETHQSLSRKINTATIKLNDFMNILDLLGFELEIRKKYTK